MEDMVLVDHVSQKDVNALVKYSQEIGAELTLLKKANNILIILEQSIMMKLFVKKNKILDSTLKERIS